MKRTSLPLLGRREFVSLLGGAPAAWPLAAWAQQGGRMRRIGVLMLLAADDAEGQVRVAAFERMLQQLGWSDGGNLRIDYRWGAGDTARIRRHAADLVALAPEVIVANSEEATAAAQRETRTVPIVFAGVGDPVASGFVASLSQPGGNLTGFTVFEHSTAGKWLELLKETTPSVVRALVIYHRHATSSAGFLHAIESAAQSLGMRLVPVGVGDVTELEPTFSAFAREVNGGLVVFPSGFTAFHRKLIVGLAARYRLPAIYPHRYFVAAGGLASYSIDFVDLFRGAAIYVDRILKGAKPADLPVQQPTRFYLVINLKTAKMLGLAVPPTLLARADEVIE